MKKEYATADEFLDDYQREATEYARQRLDVLADSEDIVMAAYYSPCEQLDFRHCLKCQLLERVLLHVNEEYDELGMAFTASLAPEPTS